MPKLTRRTFGSLVVSTGVAGLVGSSAPADGAAAPLSSVTAIETVRFRTNPEADVEVFAAYLNDLATCMGRYGTLLHRTVAFDPDGNWLLTNYWTNRSAMDRINAEFETDPPENDPGYFQMFVDFSTVSLSAFDIAAP